MRIRANGIDVHYELSGPEDGPVAMLSHSLMADLTMWDRQMEALWGYRVLRYDTRGHGATEATEGAYDFELLAADARALMGALGIARAHFVGLSMGGMVGQAMALYYPELLRSLVLCDTRGHTPPERKPIRAQRIDTARREGIEPMVSRAIEGWFSPGFREAEPDIVEGIRGMIRGTSVPGLIGCTHALNAQNYTERLSNIQAPTLIIVGEDDRGTPVSESQAMHERISGSTMVVLPKARHLSNVECAEEFNRALVDFLGRVDG